MKDLGRKEFKPPSMEAELRSLMPLVEMMEGKAFQVWIETIKGELELIEKWSWKVGGVPPKMAEESRGVAKLLSELGCDWPTTEEEIFKLWGRFRSVVNYFQNKIEWLEKQKERVEQLKREIRAEEVRRREK